MTQKAKVATDTSQGFLAFALLAFWPFANFISHNQRILHTEEILQTLAIYFALIIPTTLLAKLFFKIASIKRTAPWYALLGTGFLLFFSYNGLSGLAHRLLELWPSIAVGINHIYGLMGVCILLFVCLLTWKTRHGAQIITAFAATAVALPVASYVFFVLSSSGAGSKNAAPNLPEQAAFVQRPNVYYIVTDEYARHDKIQEITGYDNFDFISWLKAEHFNVSHHSWSNYPTTFLSLTSSLSMDYPYKDGDKVTSRQYAHRIIGGDNPVVKRFRQNGYYYFHTPAVLWNGSRCSGTEDVCLKPPLAINSELLSNILSMTPLAKVIQRYTMNGKSISTFENISKHLNKVKHNKPFFVFFHSLLPHSPFIFNPDCSLKIDASMRLTGTATPKDLGETPKGFVDNLQCANKQLKLAVNTIKKDDPDAIIIIHADHGTSFKTDWHLDPRKWSEEQLTERFAIQMAMYLPESCQTLAYEGISPVNVFEVVFACLENREPTFKPDISYGFLYELPGNEDQRVHEISLPRAIPAISE